MKKARKKYRITYSSAFPVMAKSKKDAMAIAAEDLKLIPEETRATIHIDKAERWNKDRHFINTEVQEAIIYMFILLVLGIMKQYGKAMIVFFIAAISALHHISLNISRVCINLEELDK